MLVLDKQTVMRRIALCHPALSLPLLIGLLDSFIYRHSPQRTLPKIYSRSSDGNTHTPSQQTQMLSA